MRAWLEIDGTRFASDDWPAAEDRRPVFKATLRPEGTRGPGEEWWFTEGVWKGENPAPNYLLEVVQVETEAEVEGRIQIVPEEFARPLWGHPGVKWQHEFPPEPGLALFLDQNWHVLRGFGRESFRGEAGRWVLEAPFFNEEAEFNREPGGKTPDRETRSREDTETLLDAAVGPDAGLRAAAKGGRADWGGDFEVLWAKVEEARKCRAGLAQAAEERRKRLWRRIRRGAVAVVIAMLAIWGLWAVDGLHAQAIRDLTREGKFAEADAKRGESFFFGAGQSRVVSALAANRKAREDWVEARREEFTAALEGRRWDEACQIGRKMEKKTGELPPEMEWAGQLEEAERALAKAAECLSGGVTGNQRESLAEALEMYNGAERDFGAVAREHDPATAEEIARGTAAAVYALEDWDRAEAARRQAAEEAAQRAERERWKRIEEARRREEAARRAAEQEKPRMAATEVQASICILKAQLGGREVAARIVGGLKTKEETTPKKVRVRLGQKPRFRMEYMEGGRLYIGEVSLQEGGGGTLVAELTEASAGTVKTIALSNASTMELVWCPPGSFKTDNPDSKGWFAPKQKTVAVTNGFWIAKTEVTQKQWRSVMGNNPSRFQGDDLPVEYVKWEDAQRFCRKAGLALPTEAQWEYACRAGSTGPYAGSGNLDDMGWYADNSEGRTHPVGKKKPNAWGLYDMHGNVREWCADGYRVGGELRRVIRGGCFADEADRCRSASRSVSRFTPHWTFGFRPVMVLP